jgi:hypothetical protein
LQLVHGGHSVSAGWCGYVDRDDCRASGFSDDLLDQFEWLLRTLAETERFCLIEFTFGTAPSAAAGLLAGVSWLFASLQASAGDAVPAPTPWPAWA